MNLLVVGRCSSGKSDFAESLSIKTAGGGQVIYLATMIPFDRAGRERIKRHRRKRAGKGFITLECPVRVDKIPAYLKDGDIDLKSSTCLLECISNLAGNEMHAKENRGLSEDELTELICCEVRKLSCLVKNLIVVTNEFEADREDYDVDTKKYVELTGRVNRELKKYMDMVYIKSKGEWMLEEDI